MPASSPPPLVSGQPSQAAELARIAASSLPEPWPERVFAEELARPRSRSLVATCDGQVVGYALGWRVLDELDLHSLAVDPAWRWRGIGRGLLRAYFEQLRAEGVRRVSLEVRASNQAAQGLYGALGMERCGQRPGYYRDGESAQLFRIEWAAAGRA